MTDKKLVIKPRQVERTRLVEVDGEMVEQPYSVEIMGGESVALDAAEKAAIEAERQPTLQKLKASVVQMMATKQDGGIVFNGLDVATNTVAVADISGAIQKGRTTRKVVTRSGKGARSALNQAGFEALFDVIETYRYSVMEHAYDLLEALDAAQDPATVDIDAGWPSNVFNV